MQNTNTTNRQLPADANPEAAAAFLRWYADMPEAVALSCGDAIWETMQNDGLLCGGEGDSGASWAILSLSEDETALLWEDADGDEYAHVL